MAIAPETHSKVVTTDLHQPEFGVLPIDPPTPSFIFSVPSLTVKNPRSLFKDSDYAMLAINVLAADNTVLQQYAPVTRSLGDLGKGVSINPEMAITGITVPDGATLAIAFIVVNKGSWKGLSEAVNALELAGSAVLGALAQGSIAASTGPQSVPIAWVIGVGAVILGALEGINILFADCDGPVVTGANTIGKTELLQFAAPGPWKMTYDYPGTNSPDGCGANSQYEVVYSVEATPPAVVVPTVAVPQLVGLSLTVGRLKLQQAGLIGVETILPSTDSKPSNIVAQNPPAGTMVAVHSEVTFDIRQHMTMPPHKAGQPDLR